MKNRYFLYIGVALILVVLVIAFVVFTSVSEDRDVATALPTAIVQAEQPTPAPTTAEEELTAEPAEKTPEEAGPDSSAEESGEAPAMEDFTSMTEFFSLQVPVGWSSEEALPGAAFTMANSDSALERHKAGTALETGDSVLNIGFLPYALLRQRELSALDIQIEAPPDVFLASLMPMFRVGKDVQIGDPELVTLPDGREAARLAASEEGREGLILVYRAGDDVIAVVSAVSSPGEMADLQEITNVVAAGITFSGAQDALYGILLGG